MKESIESTWTVQSIIFFILIFAAFLSLVIQYSKAYLVKNEVLNILEKYEGAQSSKEIIGNYLLDQAYKTKGKCSTEDGWYGAIDYTSYEAAEEGKNYLFCIQKETTNNRIYYNVVFFYKFNLPIIGDITTFRVVGKTKTFKGADNQFI